MRSKRSNDTLTGHRAMLRISCFVALLFVLSACAVKQPGSIDETAKTALPETTEIAVVYVEATNAATGEVTDDGSMDNHKKSGKDLRVGWAERQ